MWAALFCRRLVKKRKDVYETMRKMKRLLSILVCAAMLLTMTLSASAVGQAASGIKATNLTQTSSAYDIGIAADNVRLAWELGSDARGVMQSAYQLRIRDAQGIVYDTGWVESAEQTGIKAENLQPETVYYWSVNVRDQNGKESGFSAEASFETAPAAVSGAWIGTANLLRKEFTLYQPVANIDRARSYIGSTSPLEIHLNGQKVGDLVLSPKRPVADVEAYYNTYDILPLLQDGENAVGVMVSNAYTLGNRACGMLKIYYQDGSTQEIATGPDWQMTNSSMITRSNWYSGEDIDANLMNGWDTAGFEEDSSWTSATKVGDPVYDGMLHIPESNGNMFAKQSFSGDYTIEAGLIITKSIGSILFGSSSPNPAMWQFDADNGTLRAHRPSGWSAGDIDVIACDGIRLNTLMNVKIDIAGTAVNTYIDGELVNSYTIAEGTSAGPVGFRTAINESFNVDYLRVIQNGETVFEDNFDSLNKDCWSITSSAELVPGISGTTIIDETKPVKIYPVSTIDTSKPYSSNGHLVIPNNSGTFFTHQSFSGDYTIEVAAKTPNVFGLLFGNGSPNPLMAQMATAGGGQVKMHQPSDWSQNITVVQKQMNLSEEFVPMRVEVSGTAVKISVNGELVTTVEVPEGSTSGPIGIRETIDENCEIDYLRVIKNGQTVFEDQFDTINTDSWTIPAQNTAAGFDTTKPYCTDGILTMPTNCGLYYTRQSFSGDYTIELEAKSDNVFGFLFGSGSPYPAMWQLSGNNLRAHLPGAWNDVRVSAVDGLNAAQMTKMKLDIVGNQVTATINGVNAGTIELPEGSASGPLGMRETIAESCQMNYVRVIQNGEVVFEDDFDFIDTSKWTFPAQSQRYVVDFGKNMAGYVRVNAQAEKGSSITLKYSELVDEVGSIFANTTFHYPYCTYTFSGGEDTFEPYFFYTGFRYVEVSGIDNPTADMFTACFVSDDVEQTGQFESSNSRLNAIYDLYYRAQRSNMVGNYTDCPQREKNGWTGDCSVTKQAASILFGDYMTAEAYMRTMLLNIYDDGMPTCILPRLTTDNSLRAQFDTPWASAHFVFPYYTYLQTGDRYYIEMMYDGLVKIFDYYKATAAEDGVTTHNLYGDWLGYDNQEGKLDRGALSADYTYYSGLLLSKMAEIIGRDHTDLDAFLEKMYNGLQARYNQGDYFSTNTQTANSMALDFDLVPPDQKDTIIDSLVKNVYDAGCLRTGVLGTMSIYNALSEANEHKALMDVTLTGKKSSFGYMIDNGATTMWEYWDKAGETFNSNLTPGNAVWDSQNHCMMGGGLTTWMFEGLGGIKSTSAAYHTITFRPGLESELTFVNSSVDTVIGKAVSNWTYENDVLDWTVTVPVNAQATILIPIEDATVIQESGVNVFKKDGNGLTYAGLQDGAYVYTAGSGTYDFHVTKEAVLPEYSVEAVDAQGAAITQATAGEAFRVAAITSDDVTLIALFNEYGLRMGIRDLTSANNGDGTVTWTFTASIGTVGSGRILTLAVQDASGGYVLTDASFTMDITPVKPLVLSASIEETGVVNHPIHLTVVTSPTASKLVITNEFGLKMGILSSSYQDIDGERVWDVQIRIGTAGTRCFKVAAKNVHGSLSDPVLTNQTVVTRL